MSGVWKHTHTHSTQIGEGDPLLARHALPSFSYCVCCPISSTFLTARALGLSLSLSLSRKGAVVWPCRTHGDGGRIEGGGGGQAQGQQGRKKKNPRRGAQVQDVNPSKPAGRITLFFFFLFLFSITSTSFITSNFSLFASDPDSPPTPLHTHRHIQRPWPITQDPTG